MNSSTEITTLDLSTCDKEKIHHISYIQSHGAFVAVSMPEMRIQHASSGLGSFFKQTEDVHYYVGKKLNEVIGHELYVLLQEKLKSPTLVLHKELKFVFNHQFDIYIYQIRDALYGIEFENALPEVESAISREEILLEFVQRLHHGRSLEEITREACRAIRALTGMERVMMYKFYPPTMYGQVIAEDKVASAHSFMNHRFPATDIPKPARDLYLRNHVRFIHDSHSVNHELYPKLDVTTHLPLDMSDSKLRGVSPIHLEYMKNMGVRGAISIAVIVDNHLWGLISGHSKTPMNISHATRAMCETIGTTVALGASMYESLQDKGQELNFYNRLHHLFAKLKKSSEPLDQLFREGPSVFELFNCQGMALASEKKVDLVGLTPLPVDIKRLWTWVLERMNMEGKNILVFESLKKERPEFANLKDQVSGLMCIRISEMSDSILFLMRPEYLETIFWGGDPRKNIEARNYNGSINPRESFNTWSETISHYSKPWSKYEVQGMEFFRNLIFDSLIAKEQLLNELQEKLSKKN